jgi:hypothetical protein
MAIGLKNFLESVFFIDNNDNLGIIDDLHDLVGQKPGNKGDFLENKILVCPDQLGETHVSVEYFNGKAFSQKLFQYINNGTGTKVIGPFLETQAKEPDFLLAEGNDLVKHDFLLQLIADFDIFDNGTMQVQIVRDGPQAFQVLGKAGPAEGKTRFKICR